MNKYEEAYKTIVNKQIYVSKEVVLKAEEEILELVKRATPMKPNFSCDDWYCPKCDEIVFLGEWKESYHKPNFCANCSQAIDWSTDENIRQ
jgi:hypothetical protein